MFHLHKNEIVAHKQGSLCLGCALFSSGLFQSFEKTMGVRVEGQEMSLLELIPKTALIAAGKPFIH